MVRAEWIRKMSTEETVFRITRGCDRCGYYLQVDEDGNYQCTNKRFEEICKAEHKDWLEGEMDF